MRLEIIELLESLVDEVALDEDNKDTIIHEYYRRLYSVLKEDDAFSYPEEHYYIG